MSQRIGIAATGNKDEGINVINPRYMAEAWRNARGMDCGVLDASFYSSADPTGAQRVDGSYMWACSCSSLSSGISVGRGMATAYGYDIQSESTYTLTSTDSDIALSNPSTGASKYYFVYLEFKLGNEPAEGWIKIHDNGSAPVWTSVLQQNLITSPTGTYQMPIHRVKVTNTSGAITISIDSWETLNTAETITRPLTAQNALYAETAESTAADTRIATTQFVSKAIAANYEEIQSMVNKVEDQMDGLVTNFTNALNFSSTTLTVAGVAVKLTRLGSVVVGIISSPAVQGDWWNYSEGTTYTLPDGFAPTSTQYFSFSQYAGGGGYYGTVYSTNSIEFSVSTDGVITIERISCDTNSYSGHYTMYVDCIYGNFGWQCSASTISKPSISGQVTPTVTVTLGSVVDSVGDGEGSVRLTNVKTATCGNTVTFGLEVHGYARKVLSVSAKYNLYLENNTIYTTYTPTDNGDGTYSVDTPEDTSTLILKRELYLTVTIGYEGATDEDS